MTRTAPISAALVAAWLAGTAFAVTGPFSASVGRAGETADSSGVEPPVSAETVTTDSPEYCAHLERRIEVMQGRVPQPPAAEVERQSAEGARLCGEGNARTGILHLRRALVLLAHPAEQPSR